MVFAGVRLQVLIFVCGVISTTLLTGYVNAQQQNCTFRVSEVYCQEVQDCNALRRYRGDIVSSLVVVRSCSQALRKADLYKFRNITEIVVRNTPVEDNAFEYMAKVIRMELQNVSITELHENAFTANKALTSLTLTDSGVEHLPANVFQHLRDLRKLYLRNNSIGDLEPGVFQHNTALRILDVSHNGIRKLKRGVFYFKNVLKAHLLLSYNGINEIENGTFESCTEVTKLLLDHNEISWLGESDLHGLASLRVLDVSNNRLEVLLPSSFAYTPELMILRAESNQIAKFGPGLVTWAHDISLAIFLEGNPLDCECGPLAEAYEQSARLGHELHLTCHDGRDWNILAHLCRQHDEDVPQIPTSTVINAWENEAIGHHSLDVWSNAPSSGFSDLEQVTQNIPVVYTAGKNVGASVNQAVLHSHEVEGVTASTDKKSVNIAETTLPATDLSRAPVDTTQAGEGSVGVVVISVAVSVVFLCLIIFGVLFVRKNRQVQEGNADPLLLDAEDV